MGTREERKIAAAELFSDARWDQLDQDFRLWGEVPPHPRVAIVGSRRASSHGLKAVRRLCNELVHAGVNTISGGALGVDQAVHEATLAAGGKTLVMAPTGLDEPFPPENRELFFKIIDSGGGFLTHALKGQKAQRSHFFRRNAQMVALSDCIVLGEFPVRSGTRNTWSHARKADKAVFVLPPQFGESSCLGSIEALESADCCACARTEVVVQFLQELGYCPDSPTPASANQSESKVSRKKRRPVAESLKESSLRDWAQKHLEGAELQVFMAIFSGARTEEEVYEKVELSSDDYQASLTRLQLEGCVGENQQGHLCIQNPRNGR